MASTLHEEWAALPAGTRFRHKEWGHLLIKSVAGRETYDITDIERGSRGPMTAYLDVNIPLMEQIELYNTDVKYFEIRDEGTCIPAMAVKIDNRWITRRGGYSPTQTNIILITLSTMHCQQDAYSWDGRTMREAHLHIYKEWDKLRDNQVIDVEYILGIRSEPKVSESEVSSALG